MAMTLSEKFSHLAFNRERIRNRDFQITWYLLFFGFLMMIFGFVMIGLSSSYYSVVPQLIPLMTIVSGINSMLYGYCYLKEY